MTTKAFDGLLEKYPAEVRTLALKARERIREVLPTVDENVDASAAVVGFGAGSGYKGMICTLILSKSGVKLGLVGGASLPDPEGLLEGTGKVHRYVQLRSESDLRNPGLAKLLKAADAASRER